MEDSLSSEVAIAKDQSSRFSTTDILLSVGFALMLAWHYEVLFTVAFGDNPSGQDYSYLFSRQFALYISLAVSFAVVGFLSRLMFKSGGTRKRTTAVIVLAGLCATGVSAAYVLSSGWGEGARLGLVVLLGFFEALLMSMWLRLFVVQRTGRFASSFAAEMIAGGAIGIFVCCLQPPMVMIITAILPTLTACALAFVYYGKEGERAATGTVEPDGTEDGELVEERPGEANEALEERGEENGDEAIASPETKRRSQRSVFMAFTVAMYALAVGLLQGSFFVSGESLLIAVNPAVLVGIVVAGALIYSVPGHLDKGTGVDVLHRYSLIMLVFGAVGIAWTDYSFILGLCSEMALLAGFNLFDFGVLIYGIRLAAIDGENEVLVIDYRRTIVYLSLAVGVGIGHFAISSLDPSLIQVGLTAVCGIAIVAIVGTTMFPFYAISQSEPHSEEADGEATRRALENYIVPVEKTSQTVGDVVGPSTFAAPVPEKSKYTWREACADIAETFKLSRRETEIFHMLAKGRNADYVQRNLYISEHTAKTHIANIYRKLDIHSAQELLDLVEDFHEERKRELEAQN